MYAPTIKKTTTDTASRVSTPNNIFTKIVSYIFFLLLIIPPSTLCACEAGGEAFENYLISGSVVFLLPPLCPMPVTVRGTELPDTSPINFSIHLVRYRIEEFSASMYIWLNGAVLKLPPTPLCYIQL